MHEQTFGRPSANFLSVPPPVIFFRASSYWDWVTPGNSNNTPIAICSSLRVIAAILAPPRLTDYTRQFPQLYTTRRETMSDNPATLDPRKIETLRAIMKALRTPRTGCPWDLEQNFETIAPYTIEEAYEVADAITRGNRTDLCEELGDLLLQTIYHAQMADEEGAFTFDDVLEAINTKMVRRHPHVFGDEAARSANSPRAFGRT